MGKDKLKSKNIMTRDDLVAYLETVLLGLKQGTLILDNEERPLILRPSDSIEAELEIKQKSDKEKLELKLSWVPSKMQPLTPVATQLEAPILSSPPLGDEAKKNELKEAAEAAEAAEAEEVEEDRTYGTYRTYETNENTELPATHTSHKPHTTHSSYSSHNSPQKALYAIVREALAQGQKIPLPGLGSFSVTLHAARMGRNPRTGESIAIPARRRVHFKAAKGLRQLLNP